MERPIRCAVAAPLLLMLALTRAVPPPSSLKLVNVLYRHGDRSPVTTYPTDKHQVPGAWPDGLGWLSNTGKQQQYELGQWIGQRYGGFLNTTRYNNSEILIQASGVPRCLASAYSNLAGLFPPKDDQKLAMHGSCPRYDELMDKEMRSPKVVKEETDNKEFYEWVAKETGVNHQNLKDIWEIHDPLVCEKHHNLTWNDWAQNDTVWKKLDSLATWSFDLLYGLPEMARLKGGPLLGEIVSNMQNASLVAAPSPKFYMYSAHDTTVAALLSAMQVFDCHQPMYRALVMVELHELAQGHVVQIFYRNDTSREPYELHPPGCEKPCSLDTFVRVAKQRIPIDWDTECQTDSAGSGGPTLNVFRAHKYIAALILAVILSSK